MVKLSKFIYLSVLFIFFSYSEAIPQKRLHPKSHNNLAKPSGVTKWQMPNWLHPWGEASRNQAHHPKQKHRREQPDMPKWHALFSFFTVVNFNCTMFSPTTALRDVNSTSLGLVRRHIPPQKSVYLQPSNT
jgi:hypothetical protein